MRQHRQSHRRLQECRGRLPELQEPWLHGDPHRRGPLGAAEVCGAPCEQSSRIRERLPRRTGIALLQPGDEGVLRPVPVAADRSPECHPPQSWGPGSNGTRNRASDPPSWAKRPPPRSPDARHERREKGGSSHSARTETPAGQVVPAILEEGEEPFLKSHSRHPCSSARGGREDGRGRVLPGRTRRRCSAKPSRFLSLLLQEARSSLRLLLGPHDRAARRGSVTSSCATRDQRCVGKSALPGEQGVHRDGELAQDHRLRRGERLSAAGAPQKQQARRSSPDSRPAGQPLLRARRPLEWRRGRWPLVRPASRHATVRGSTRTKLNFSKRGSESAPARKSL